MGWIRELEVPLWRQSPILRLLMSYGYDSCLELLNGNISERRERTCHSSFLSVLVLSSEVAESVSDLPIDIFNVLIK